MKPLTAAVTAVFLLAGCAVQPTPITAEERTAELGAQREAMFAGQEVVSGPIALDEAMARAIKYNLDNRLKLMEQALAHRQLDLSRFDMLPKLTASAGYLSRDEAQAASSQNYFTGEQSLVPSISSDETRQVADLTLSWNVLDFGVSYYQAKQQADQVLVMQERRRKVVHLMMQQVRAAYWQAVGAQRLQSKVEPVLALTRQALADSRRIEDERLRSPLETLGYQRQLLEILRQLEQVRDELAQAKPRLASIMNVSPGSDYQLVEPERFALPALPVAPERMEETALVHRPELIEAGYNQRIGLLETRKALARVMPGLSFDLGTHYDSNSFLVDNSWLDAGMRVGWNLLNVLNYSNIRDAAEAQYDVAKQQRLAMNMAVLTQVHVAYRDFLGRQRQFELSQEMNGVDQRILEHTRNAARLDAQGKLAEISAAAGALMSELRLYQSYGGLQNAYGQMIATLGLDPLPAEIASHDLPTLRTAIRQRERELSAQAL